LLPAVLGGSARGMITAPVKAAAGSLGGLKGKIGDALKAGGGGGGATKRTKVVNIVEEADVGLPVRVAYNQWTEFEEFPTFTRKVNKVEQRSDEEATWEAQVFLSHRSWDATIVEQVPDDRIVWTSRGAKGTVDGTVTFHELAPNLTKILLVLEYRPKGFFEQTANLWRAQGRRARADFRQIKRHMMTQTILAQDEIQGWRGEIRDREVVRTHDEVVADEERDEFGSEESDRQEPEYEDYGDEEGEYGEEEYREGASPRDERDYGEPDYDEDEEPGDRSGGRREQAVPGRRR
jgi:uncharacterized membrane protein